MIAKVQSIYRYPGEGAEPRAAAARRAGGGRDPGGRPALCHRERALRLRSGGAALPAQDALSDADAQRAAGHASHPFRGREPHARRSSSTAARPRAAICARPTAAPRSSASSPASAPTICAGRRRSCTPPASASRMLPRKVVSIINLASVAAIEDPVGAPVDPLRFRGNLYVDRLAGLARIRSGRTRRSRSGPTPGSRSSSASCAAPPPTSIPTPACATSRFPTP